jgi:hypothetical protein
MNWILFNLFASECRRPRSWNSQAVSSLDHAPDWNVRTLGGLRPTFRKMGVSYICALLFFLPMSSYRFAMRMQGHEFVFGQNSKIIHIWCIPLFSFCHDGTQYRVQSSPRFSDSIFRSLHCDTYWLCHGSLQSALALHYHLSPCHCPTLFTSYWFSFRNSGVFEHELTRRVFYSVRSFLTIYGFSTIYLTKH